MAETILAETKPPTATLAIREPLLRLAGAALQVLSTWAVVHALSPERAGVYFRGFVIANGLAALVRGKYEIYTAYHILAGRAGATGVCDGRLLSQLGARVLLRATIACGVLLVITADIDIQAPRFEPMLETYLPFVLALPCISLATFVGEALRAANRILGGTVLTAYAINFSMLLAVAISPVGGSLPLYAWTFLGGSLLSAALALTLSRRAFSANLMDCSKSITREVLNAADAREWIAFGLAALRWGPLAILAVWAPAREMAQYAVAARTALIVDFFLPALRLIGGCEALEGRQVAQEPRRLLVAQLRRVFLYSSLFVAVLLAIAPATMKFYGKPYDTQLTLYALLLGAQWLNSVGRPAVRCVVAHWDARLVGITLGSGALAAVLICFAAVGSYGALAAAAASLAGALVVNSRAILTAYGMSAPDQRG
jgi:hypothetical protein